MLPCFIAAGATEARPVALIPAADYRAWIAGRLAPLQAWLDAIAFEPKTGNVALLPGPDGSVAGALERPRVVVNVAAPQ